MDYAVLGRNIRICREAKGLTQERLAELSNISVKHISKIELGKINLKIETLVNIANALDVSTDTLLRSFLHHNEDLYSAEIMRHISKLSPLERAHLLWLLEKDKEFERRKDELFIF